MYDNLDRIMPRFTNENAVSIFFCAVAISTLFALASLALRVNTVSSPLGVVRMVTSYRGVESGSG